MCMGYVQTLHCFIPRTRASADFGPPGRSETTVHSQGCDNHYFYCDYIQNQNCVPWRVIYYPWRGTMSRQQLCQHCFLPFHFSQITTFNDRFIYLQCKKLKISKTRLSSSLFAQQNGNLHTRVGSFLKIPFLLSSLIRTDATNHFGGIIPPSSHFVAGQVPHLSTDTHTASIWVHSSPHQASGWF